MVAIWSTRLIPNIYNISREKCRRFDWFIASLFLRNSGITAKINGITRLPSVYDIKVDLKMKYLVILDAKFLKQVEAWNQLCYH